MLSQGMATLPVPLVPLHLRHWTSVPRTMLTRKVLGSYYRTNTETISHAVAGNGDAASAVSPASLATYALDIGSTKPLAPEDNKTAIDPSTSNLGAEAVKGTCLFVTHLGLHTEWDPRSLHAVL